MGRKKEVTIKAGPSVNDKYKCCFIRVLHTFGKTKFSSKPKLLYSLRHLILECIRSENDEKLFNFLFLGGGGVSLFIKTKVPAVFEVWICGSVERNNTHCARGRTPNCGNINSYAGTYCHKKYKSQGVEAPFKWRLLDVDQWLAIVSLK